MQLLNDIHIITLAVAYVLVYATIGSFLAACVYGVLSNMKVAKAAKIVTCLETFIMWPLVAGYVMSAIIVIDDEPATGGNNERPGT